MKRQEILLNLTLVVIIAALLYLLYESKEAPRGLNELPVAQAAVESAEGEAEDETNGDLDEDERDTDDADDPDDPDDAGAADGDAAIDGADAPPGSETGYAGGSRRGRSSNAPAGGDSATTGSRQSREVASAGSNRGGQFGSRNIFRALLTPTPTPTPPPPTPAPTPDIGKALGSWRLLSVYQGKAMIEDVVKAEQGAEGAIWEMPPGEKRQVDVGGGVMKTVTLKGIEADNPYNPEVTFTMEDTTAEKKINLDTEPTVTQPGPAPRQ